MNEISRLSAVEQWQSYPKWTTVWREKGRRAFSVFSPGSAPSGQIFHQICVSCIDRPLRAMPANKHRGASMECQASADLPAQTPQHLYPLRRSGGSVCRGHGRATPRWIPHGQGVKTLAVAYFCTQLAIGHS